MSAWNENEQAIKSWLVKKTGDPEQAEDLLQELFIKALQNKETFCTLIHAKSWLFTMAKNTLIDAYRKAKFQAFSVSIDTVEETAHPTIVNLQECLPRVLSELTEDDKDIIEQCDIQGLSQIEYSQSNGLSLSATKSRIQRARKKLREQMIISCNVKFDPHGVSSFTPRK